MGDIQNLVIEPLRDHFDYVYRREDLVRLAGSKYRSKRNHINQFLRFYTYVYEPLEDKHIDDCLVLQEKWCKMNRCKEIWTFSVNTKRSVKYSRIIIRCMYAVLLSLLMGG